jgi:hypothetical protein
MTKVVRLEEIRLERAMPGKRVQIDDETWAALEAVASERRKSFQEIADEAFEDLLKKHRQPVGFKAALKESVGEKVHPLKPKPRRGK